MELRYPCINGLSEQSQIQQIRSYLHQLVDNLNFNFNSIDEKLKPTQESKKGNILNINVDQIVAQGYRNGWTFRLWSMGNAECWYTGEHNAEFGYISGDNFSTFALSQETFPIAFKDIPICNVSCGFVETTGGYLLVGYDSLPTKEKTPQISFKTNLTGNYSIKVSYYAIGRWK